MAFELITQELNKLQRRLYESYREFVTTQDNLDSDELIEYFKEQATQRQEYYNAIRESIKSLGNRPKNVTRPFEDAANEIFTDIKTMFFKEDDRVILQEVVSVEERLISALDNVLDSEADVPELKKIVTEQREEVARDLEQLLKFLNVLMS